MNETLSDFDRRLLEALQGGVPLAARPYDVLAGELHAAPEAVIARVGELSAPGGIIREIAGIFDASALGYQTTLVGAVVEPARLDAPGAIVAAHPGVSHAYAREGARNLWFTLALGPDSRLGIDRTVELLGRMMGASSIHSFPTVRMYKLRVTFDMGGETGTGHSALGISGTVFDPVLVPRKAQPVGKAQTPQPRADDKCRMPNAECQVPSASEILAIRALQTPLPALAEPFDPLAREAGMPVDELLAHGAEFLARRWLRRYAAVLRHRAAGAACNVMVVWQVPEDRADAFGRRAGELAAVSHCYLRRSAPDWPWNLYTMVHGRDRAAADRTIADIAAGESPPRLDLPTGKEFKKQKVRLFTPDTARWEAAATE